MIQMFGLIRLKEWVFNNIINHYNIFSKTYSFSSMYYMLQEYLTFNFSLISERSHSPNNEQDVISAMESNSSIQSGR